MSIKKNKLRCFFHACYWWIALGTRIALGTTVMLFPSQPNARARSGMQERGLLRHSVLLGVFSTGLTLSSHLIPLLELLTPAPLWQMFLSLLATAHSAKVSRLR